MDNTQRTAADGSWFLFADWQGITRIALPGDKVKTDSGLDRPNRREPLALRSDGTVWSDLSIDVDPVALKAIRRPAQTRYAPDPLGGELPIEVGVVVDTVTVRGAPLALAPEGAELALGGGPGARATYCPLAYDVFPDGSVVLVANAGPRTLAACVTRTEGGAGRVAWCRSVALVPGGAPDAFRERGSTFLADRDIAHGTAWLVEVKDDGSHAGAWSCPAVAGPWVHGGRVFWQPDDATLCAGAVLGEAAQTFALPAPHAGPGRLLRLAGRTLFVPWHRTAMLDLAATKKGKGELSRKHKAAQEPMYRAAEELMRPLRAGMARRGMRVDWIGCVRRGKTIEPLAEIVGSPDALAYALGFALQDGARASLAAHGASSVTCRGAGAYDPIFAAPPATVDDVRGLLGMLSEAGLSWASGVPYVQTLYAQALQRSTTVPITPEAEDLMLAAVVWAMGNAGTPPPAVDAIPSPDPAAFAAAAPIVGDFTRARAAGISQSQAGLFAAIVGHRRLGADAVASLMAALAALNPTYPAEVAKALGTG